MKTLTAAFLASAFLSAPIATQAMACPGMSAEYKKPMTTAEAPVKTEEAMSTFDPDVKPVFEEELATEETSETVETVE